MESAAAAAAAAAACVSRLSSPSSSSSILFSPFSDQSHVDFYRPLVPPSLSLRSSSSSRPSLFAPAVPPLRALSDSSVVSPLLDPPQVASALLKELAELKLQMKQKKKELKAQTKEEKKKLKMQMKEEMKIMKQKDATEGKKKKMKMCSSESSSSSESSDEECKSMSMRMLRQERSLLGHTEDQVVQKDFLERDAGMPAKAQVDNSIKTTCEASCSPPRIECAMDFATQSLPRNCLDACGSSVNGVSVIGSLHREISVQKDVRGGQGLSSSRRGSASVFPSAQCANRIEVCAGGKCKKAGSEQLLSALRAHIPGSLNVEAVPCKCMGKCSMAMNVKVYKEDTNPQHHSQVRVEDANLILSHHFGLGRPPTGLPSIPSYDKVREYLIT